MTMAMPPSRGTGRPWILRGDSAWSSRPKWWASRRTIGARDRPAMQHRQNEGDGRCSHSGGRVRTQFPRASTSMRVLR